MSKELFVRAEEVAGVLGISKPYAYKLVREMNEELKQKGFLTIPFSSKVAVEREDFDRLSTLAKKYVTAEKKESKLQKALDAASKLIAKLKAEIDSLKQEISDYKSVHSKLRAAELERENTELRGKVRSYEDVIQRNNLWRFFHPRKEKAVTRDEAR